MTLTIICIWILILAIMSYNFTTVESGNYKFIVQGETWVKTIDGDDPNKHFHIFGYYWVGFRFIHKVHNFVINKYKLNPDRKPEDPKTWISHEENFETGTLRKIVTLPILMSDVELKDRTKISLLVNVILKFEEPKIFVFNLKGNYRALITIISSKVNDLVKNIDNLTEFINEDKGEGSNFFKNLLNDPISGDLSKLNEILKLNTGAIATAFNISEYSADNALLEAANAKAIADLRAEARRIDADADANYRSKQAVAEIDSLIDRLQKTGANPKEILAAVMSLKQSQGIEKHQGTLVLGNTNTNIGI